MSLLLYFIYYQLPIELKCTRNSIRSYIVDDSMRACIAHIRHVKGERNEALKLQHCSGTLCIPTFRHLFIQLIYMHFNIITQLHYTKYRESSIKRLSQIDSFSLCTEKHPQDAYASEAEAETNGCQKYQIHVKKELEKLV